MKIDIFNNVRLETHTEINDTVVDNINYVIKWIEKFIPDRQKIYTFKMLTDNIVAYTFLYKNEKLITFTSAWKRSLYANNVRILNRFTNLYENENVRSIAHGTKYLKPETVLIVSRQIEACLTKNIDFVFTTREGKHGHYKLNCVCDSLNFSFLTNEYKWKVTNERYKVAPSDTDDAFQYMCYAQINNNFKFTMLDNPVKE